MQHVPISDTLSLALCVHAHHASFYILIPDMLAVETGTGSNQRQTGAREETGETAINKLTVYSGCIRGTREDQAVPLALQASHWTIWHLHHGVS